MRNQDSSVLLKITLKICQFHFEDWIFVRKICQGHFEAWMVQRKIFKNWRRNKAFWDKHREERNPCSARQK